MSVCTHKAGELVNATQVGYSNFDIQYVQLNVGGVEWTDNREVNFFVTKTSGFPSGYCCEKQTYQ